MEFSNKNIKPTLNTPTPMGKKLDTNFNKEIRKTGMNLKEENENKHSLKKKIFKLDKMETLVHTDEFLSQKFDETKGDDPETIWGYHWNEVVLNSLFNDYVLNSPKYLQKYKNTRAKTKTRRGEEGIKQLQNDLKKEKEATSGAEIKTKELMGGEDKEKVDELFGFGSKGLGTELPMNKRSKNDTYFVDMAKKRLLAPVPFNSTPEEKQAIMQKYVGQPNIKQISWYNAVKQGIQGVPTEVSDGSIQQMDAEMAKKYPQGTANMVSLAEEEVSETTGAASAGAFSAPIGVEKKEISETTTSASSGQYSGPRIWAKSPESSRFAHKPAWKGGQIVSESVINGNKDYLTEASAFRSYILKNEIIDMMNESFEIGEAESFEQHYKKMMDKLVQVSHDYPELANDPDIQDAIKINKERAGIQQQPQHTGTVPTQTNVSEHHLDTREDKSAFILQNGSGNHNPEYLATLDDAAIDALYRETEQRMGIAENDYDQAMEKDLKYTGHPVRDNESTDELENQDGLFKGRWNTNEHTIVNDKNLDKVKDNFKPPISEEAKSKKQQKFMGMVHAAQKGELKNPSAKVAKAAENMSDKDAKDFASTKHKGLPEKVKKKKVDEGIFGNSSSELNVDQIKSIIDNFNQSPESTDLRNQFVKAKDYVKQKAGNIARMPQLKMWLDQNMPQISNYVSTLWGNWELMPKLNENKDGMKINKDQYTNYLKKKLTENAKSLMTLNEGQKKNLLKKIHEDFVKESMIDDQPDSMINNSESSMVKSMDSDELNTDGTPVATTAAAPIGGVQQEGYDTDDMKSKRPMADKLADYSDEEPVADDNVEEPIASTPVDKEASMAQDRESPETISDAEKFREMLKAKYGVDNVSSLSPLQRQELMKSMSFGATTSPDKSPIDLDVKQFNTSDADRAAYKARDEKRLSFLAHNANRVNDIGGYMALAKQFKDQTGENMFHPMAILASIEQLPQDSQMRNNLSNIENVLRSQMTKKIAESIATTLAESLNEERKPSSILNIEKLGAENAKNFKMDSAEEDALDQSKTYPKPQPADSIQKAAVYPNPKDFYIDQDVEKVNREAKSMADIEKEVLAKTKGEAFNNVGNSTNEKGNEIPKRNLTKEEAYELAMNRGDGMQNIVYDNKPSERFEKRMESDMGTDVYKNRTDKMEYRADMPMYNKDTQPTAGGDKKEENNKFKMGYNNESVSAKYRDEFGKVQLVEFAMKNVVEVTSIADDAIKLNVDGMGNKYSLVGKKINENAGFKDFVEKYSFYMTENKVVAIEKTKVIVETKIEVKSNVNESFNKMKHLMNYKPNNYVDGKNSVKF